MMKVNLIRFGLFIVWVILTIDVIYTQQPFSWWLCAMLGVALAIENLTQALEDS